MICSLRQKEALLRSVVSACDPPGSVALTVQRGLRKFGVRCVRTYDRQTVGMFEGLAEAMVDADGLKLFVRHGGAGPAMLLLHRYPRTSATWHRVAPQLATLGLTVVCADLPGYGRSGKPTPTADHASHSKRAGARHLVAAMRTLGHDRFAVVGHDRGSYYVFRLARSPTARLEDRALGLPTD